MAELANLVHPELPGFLQGKLYGDFRPGASYEAGLELLTRALGPATPPPQPDQDEIEQLRRELETVRQIAERHHTEARRAGRAAYEGKSDELKEAIEEANEQFPAHAPINRTYAFELGSMPITLDYALWAIAKSERQGSHPLELLLTLEDRWGDIENMLEAYQDMVGGGEAAAGEA